MNETEEMKSPSGNQPISGIIEYIDAFDVYLSIIYWDFRRSTRKSWADGGCGLLKMYETICDDGWFYFFFVCTLFAFK